MKVDTRKIIRCNFVKGKKVFCLECVFCNREFFLSEWRYNSGRGKYCSVACANKGIKRRFGEDNNRWNGGRTRRNGYIFIKNPDKDGKRFYVREHRSIIEKKIGRKLKEEEVVHHINGKRDDNRIENLMLLPTDKWHRRIHNGWVKKGAIWEKPCGKCKKILELKNFYKRKTGTKGYLSICKLCCSQVGKLRKHKKTKLIQCIVCKKDWYIRKNQTTTHCSGKCVWVSRKNNAVNHK